MCFQRGTTPPLPLVIGETRPSRLRKVPSVVCVSYLSKYVPLSESRKSPAFDVR